MQIGISLSSTHPGADPRSGPAAMIERARAAYAAGFATLAVGDHHNMDVSYVQNSPILGRLLADWTGRPAGLLFLLPLWNPVLAAEHIGTLAAIHDGPFVVQTGIGSGDAQFAAFGTVRKDRARRTDEAIAVIRRMLDGERVDSPMFGVQGGRVGLRPPHPVEWWIGAGADVALERAARLGDVWYAPVGYTVAQLARSFATYRDRCDEHGREARAVVRRDALVLDDPERAERLAGSMLAAGYRGLAREHVVVGNAEQARQQLAELADLGFEQVMIRCMSSDRSVALGTIDLLGSPADI